MDVKLCGGSGIEDVRCAFGEGRWDHVIMGAGIDLASRLAIVREVFGSSDTTTVHMKDAASGKEAPLRRVGPSRSRRLRTRKPVHYALRR